VGPDYEPTIEQGIGFYAPEARPVIQAAVQAGIERGEPWDLELPFVTAKQRHLWVRAAGEVEFEDGRAVRLVGAFQDITERKRLEHDVASQAATLRLVTEAIPATVAVIGPDLRYRFANSAFEQACGLARDRIVGRSAREVLGDEEFERREPWIARALAGEPVVFELDYPGREGATHRSINYVPLRLATGEVDGFVVVGQDITAQRREALRLIELTQCDPLTGLLNRAGFEQFLQRHVDLGAGQSLALLYIDLDHFKPVNDQHGHTAGDQVLKLFGQRLAKLVRPSDAVARLGGDEFAVALVGARDVSNARTVADKVLAAAHAPFKLAELTIDIGASVGVAFGVDPATGWAELVGRADAKLLAAKAAGKGRQMGADVR
jgi:diguanylate cyclase (GGDEF)-like protein/PAS domain S-box-containing protein